MYGKRGKNSSVPSSPDDGKNNVPDDGDDDDDDRLVGLSEGYDV
jgi:hypothetical protein